MDTHLEIERKYLIAMPSTIRLSRISGATVTHITQTYLVSQQGVTRRVRKSSQVQYVAYTYSQKLIQSSKKECILAVRRACQRVRKNIITYSYNEKSNISDISRLEKDAIITQQNYLLLLQQSDPSLSAIIKTRYALPQDGFVCEIDIYPFWRQYAILEVELAAKDIHPPIPSFISIIKEVTHDKAFSNHSLSRTVPQLD